MLAEPPDLIESLTSEDEPEREPAIE